MNSTKTVFLDLYGRNRAVRVWVKQYDTGRKLRVVLRCDGQPCPASPSDTALVTYTRPDGQTQAFLCTVQADGSILAPIPGWAVQHPGTGFGCVSVIGADNDRHTTLDLVLQVEEGEALFHADVMEGEEADILTQLISSVSDLRKSYLDGIAELESRPAGHDPEADAALLAWMGTVNGILTSLSQAIAGIKLATIVYGIPEGGTKSDIIDLSGVSAPPTAEAETKRADYEAMLQRSPGGGEDDPGGEDGPGTGGDTPGGDEPQNPDEPDNPGGGDEPEEPDDPGTDEPEGAVYAVSYIAQSSKSELGNLPGASFAWVYYSDKDGKKVTDKPFAENPSEIRITCLTSEESRSLTGDDSLTIGSVNLRITKLNLKYDDAGSKWNVTFAEQGGANHECSYSGATAAVSFDNQTHNVVSVSAVTGITSGSYDISRFGSTPNVYYKVEVYA